MKNKTLTTILYIALASCSRLIPHPPNVTPLVNLSLFAGVQLSRAMSFIIIIASLIFSDIGLHFIYGYPIFGSWSIFTYSFLLMLVWIGSKINFSARNYIMTVLFSSLGFWLWTNFGTWLLSGIYPKNLNGIIDCYLAALPFLRNQLLGDFMWLGATLYCLKKIPSFSLLNTRTIAGFIKKI